MALKINRASLDSLHGLPRELGHMQDAIRRLLRQLYDAIDAVLARLAWLDGKRIDDLAFSAGVTKDIAHGLGRAYTGWIVLRDHGTNKHQLFEDSAATTNPKTTLSLVSAVDCTVDLWVS